MVRSADLFSFEVGSVYRRQEIHNVFGGQRQGGISTPAQYPAIFLFTGDDGNAYGYRDEWKDDGFFHYTGEGQVDDMKMARGNYRLMRHAQNGDWVLLFEKVGRGQYRFSGYMEYATHYEAVIPDVTGKLRSGIIFKLKPITLLPRLDADRHILEFERATLDSLRGKAIEASRQKIERDTRLSTFRDRSRTVAAYVLKRAYGFCEGCGRPAPFRRKDGSPYLEAHHTHRISDEGPDSPSHVMALCPTCHTRVHHAEDGAAYNRAIAGFPAKIEEALDANRAKIVTAALMIDSTDRVFVAQRSGGDLAGFWEFPGGKMRPGENPYECVRREILEELRVSITQVRPFASVDHDYKTMLVRLLCFTCRTMDSPQISEHSAGQWVSIDELARLSLAPADARVARRLQPLGNV